MIEGAKCTKAEKLYPKLADSVSKQVIFEFENVSGTLVGFRTPDYAKGINVPGYHLHFITENRSEEDMSFSLNLRMELLLLTQQPLFYGTSHERQFFKIRIGQDLKSELETVEK